MRSVGVIPARGGSKGLPRKNILPLQGKPLLIHTVEAARRSRLDRCIVSSEDPGILAVARHWGAEVIERPAELARDDTRTEPVLVHALDALESSGFRADVVVTLEPTSPLRPPTLIDACLERLAEGDCDAVLTVVETRSVYGRLRGGTFEPLFPAQPRRRQEREPLYRESSTVYVTRVEALRATGSVLGSRAAAVMCSERDAVDINDRADLDLAEALLSQAAKV